MNEPQNQTSQIYPYAMPTDFLSKEECDLLRRTLLKQFSEDEQLSFVRVCQRTRLDPFTKQIYATKRYQKVKDENSGETKKIPTLVPVTGIMGLCAVAERTGNYDGCEIAWSGADGVWKPDWLADEYPAAARCTVYHKKRTHPEIAIARWQSYVGQTYNYQTKTWEVSEFWDKMPDYMLAKCSKAAALRGAFPEPLSNVYIREELESNITDAEETESIPADEAKIAANQRRDEEIKAHPPKGVTIVEAKPGGVKPTPAEALEPAFSEDKIPPKVKEPVSPAAVQAPALAPERKVDPYVKEPPDDLDISAPKGPQKLIEIDWKAHVIKSIDHVKFLNRKIGDLSPKELTVIENQWLPQVIDQWKDATDLQRADAEAFKVAIAFQKAQPPW